MHFALIPVLDLMIDLYQIKDPQRRFKAYLNILQDPISNEMLVPIDGYNPMAKPNIIDRLLLLKKLNAEKLIADILAEINPSLVSTNKYKVALNIADNIGGAWTNRLTTDFDNKFRSRAKRDLGFCTPTIWIEEGFSSSLIIERTKESIQRTNYQIAQGDPQTLQEHVAQEIHVNYQNDSPQKTLNKSSYKLLDDFYQTHKLTTDYSIIFNFFYGDKASLTMGYKAYGIITGDGFQYCKRLSTELTK